MRINVIAENGKLRQTRMLRLGKVAMISVSEHKQYAKMFGQFDPIFLNATKNNNISRSIHMQEKVWKNTHQKVNSSYLWGQEAVITLQKIFYFFLTSKYFYCNFFFLRQGAIRNVLATCFGEEKGAEGVIRGPRARI